MRPLFYAVLFLITLLPFVSSMIVGRLKRRSVRWMNRGEDARRWLGAIPGVVAGVILLVALTVVSPAWF